MFNKICLFLMLILLAGCASKSATTSKTPDAKSTQLTEIPQLANYSLGAPIERDNMAIVPVISEKRVIQEEYATLSEAKKFGWIEITEMSGQEEVSKLQVRNTGTKAIMLLGGELLLGGKQDRMVAKDTLVYPGQTVVVDVYCVEHGRWSNSYKKFESGDTMVPLNVRKAAQESQEGVWAEVDKFNVANGLAGASRTVNSGLNSEQVRNAIAKMKPELEKELLSRDDIVGMVFLVNGKIETFEIFGNNALFRQGLSPLLSSFISQAVISPQMGSVAVPLEECAKFVSSSLTAPKTQSAGGMGVVSDAGVQGYELKDMRAGRDTEDQAPIHGTFSKSKD